MSARGDLARGQNEGPEAATDELALAALSTPAVGASDALEVLVDVLLEAGLLSEPRPSTTANDDAAMDLRRRAYHWAKRRLAPLPNPVEQLVEIATTALREASLPVGIVGIVGPFVLRVHYLEPVEPSALVLARGAIARCLPSSIVVEVTQRPASR